jgi:hypothetical protein
LSLAEFQVECHSGSQYAEYPLAFTWQDRRLEVVEILDRRRTPAGKGFRVRAVDEQVYDLFYDELSQVWQVYLA